jgi:hypothetical protein
MKSDIERTCGSVRTSLSAPERLVTVESEAAEKTYLRSSERRGGREAFPAAASVKGGRRVRLNEKSNTCELLWAPLVPKSQKTLTGSGQKATQSAASPGIWGTRTIRLPACKAGASSFVSSQRNRLNPAFRLDREAGVTARRADGVTGRGCWKKQRPSCNGTDRGGHVAPLRKQADFQQVVRDERTVRTFKGGNRK